MNAVATAEPPKVEKVSPAIAWFPVAAFALVWLEVCWRLQFEWVITQYSYGYAGPFLRLSFGGLANRACSRAPRPAHSESRSYIAAVYGTISIIRRRNPMAAHSWAIPDAAASFPPSFARQAAELRAALRFSIIFFSFRPWPE